MVKMGGVLIRIHHGVIFTQLDGIFTTYIDFVAKLEDRCQVPGLLKGLVNTLAGIFGSMGTKTIMYKPCNHDVGVYDFTDQTTQIVVEFGNNKYKGNHLPYRNDYNRYDIASIVTARARIKLYEGMVSVINSGGRLLYVNTDSIVAQYP